MSRWSARQAALPENRWLITRVLDLHQRRQLSVKRISELTGLDRDGVRGILARAGLYRLSPSRERRFNTKGVHSMNLPDIELVAAKVHEAWMDEKRRQGITTRPAEDGTEQMVPYEELPEHIKDYDRALVRTVYTALTEVVHEPNPAS